MRVSMRARVCALCVALRAPSCGGVCLCNDEKEEEEGEMCAVGGALTPDCTL